MWINRILCHFEGHSTNCHCKGNICILSGRYNSVQYTIVDQQKKYMNIYTVASGIQLLSISPISSTTESSFKRLNFELFRTMYL